MKLCKSQKQLLSVLGDGRLYSYFDLVRATGKYSNLHGELRHCSYRGLGSRGLVREDVMTPADLGCCCLKLKVYVFQVTRAGCCVLGIDPPALLVDRGDAIREFAARYRDYHEQYQRDEQLARSIGLRHNSFVLLRALGSDPDKEWTFADLARATGLFSGLVQDLRSRHARHRSLASLSLIRESFRERESETRRMPVFTFQILPAGLELLNGAHTIAPPARKKPRRRLAPPLICWDE